MDENLKNVQNKGVIEIELLDTDSKNLTLTSSNFNSSNNNFCILKSENYMDSQLPDLPEASGMFIIIFSMVFMIFEIIQLIRVS